MINESFRRDANGVPITGLGLILKKTITFAAGTTGAVGTHTLFTVSGNNAVDVFAVCKADLTGSGTLEIGVAGLTTALAGQQNATAIDLHEVWHNSSLAIATNIANQNHIVDQDIILTIGTNTVTGGTLDIYCLWNPLDPDSNVEVA